MFFHIEKKCVERGEWVVTWGIMASQGDIVWVNGIDKLFGQNTQVISILQLVCLVTFEKKISLTN